MPIPALKTPLHALLFDVDGTLADTEEIHRLSFNQAFADAGLDWTWDVRLYGELLAVTGGRERIRHYIEHYRPDFNRPLQLDDWIKALHLDKTAIYTGTLAAGRIPLRPGVKRLIAEARSAGLRLAIATTTSPANVTALLEHSLAPDSASWFDVIGAGDVVAAKKPAPDIYHYTLEALDLPASACLSFEDSENGVRASLGAGIPTVVTMNDYTRDHDFSGAAVVLDHLGDVDQPCTTMTGSHSQAGRIDVPYLRHLHARLHSAALT